MRSIRYALMLSVGYAVLAAVYIAVSSRIAAHMSASVEDMERIEVFKGFLFVTVTAIGVLAGSWFALQRIERVAAELQRRDRVLMANERRIFAGVMSASIAHDANNVLVAVLADLQFLRETLGGDDENLNRLQHSAERLASLNRRLLEIVRQGRAGRAEEVDLTAEVRRSLEAVRSHRTLRGCSVDVQGREPVTLRTHPLLVHQIVSNLVVNAGEATEGHGHIEVRLAKQDGTVQIEVHDDGPGIPADRRARLFDALETTKREGSGLGLFSVKSCASALGGSVEVGDSALGGACFRVRLPVMLES